MKVLKCVTLTSICISVLYAALAAVLSFSDVSFRTWAGILGQVMAALVTPLLILSLLLALLWNNPHLTNLPKAVITMLSITLYITGAFFVSLLIALGREEETMLTKNLIAVQKSYSMNDSDVSYWRPAGLFFKKSAELTDADRAAYLCSKYDLEFIADENSGRIYETAHPEITVTVTPCGASFTDDYMDELTCRYLREGYAELGMTREYVLCEKENDCPDSSFRLIGKNLRDLPALSKDLYTLAGYCIDAGGGDSEENIYRRHFGSIAYSFGGADESCHIFRLSFQYGTLNPEAIKEETLANYQYELASQKQEPLPDSQEKSAKMIYDAFLAEEGFSYTVYFNAKGNLYIELGSKEDEGQIYDYRLVYDRPSQNGLCELFVLYRTKAGSSEETIVDMYAAEPDSGEVVRSGRKTWSDVGTKAYRDLTGE